MNKTDLIEAVAQSEDLPKAVASRIIDATLSAITTALKSDDPVVLVGFGTFQVKDRPARVGRNPKTGEPIDIKAARAPSFKAGKGLKEAVNA